MRGRGPVAPPAGERDADRHEQDRAELKPKHQLLIHPQRLRCVPEREGGRDVIDREARHRAECSADRHPPVIAQQLAHRHRRRRAFRHHRAECWRLADPQPHPQPQPDQHDRQGERHAPAPGEELRGSHRRPQHQEQPVGGNEPDRRAELRHHAVAATLARRRILDGQQSRSAPFAAEPEALPEAQQAQQDRREIAGAVESRQEGDRERRSAHQHQARHQCRLAPDAVAVMSERPGADRSREEGDGEAAVAREQPRGLVACREEERAEHEARRRRVDVEVVELDRGADEAREEDARVGVGHRSSLAAGGAERNGERSRPRFLRRNKSGACATHARNLAPLDESSPSFSPLLATAAGPFPFWLGNP